MKLNVQRQTPASQKKRSYGQKPKQSSKKSNKGAKGTINKAGKLAAKGGKKGKAVSKESDTNDDGIQKETRSVSRTKVSKPKVEKKVKGYKAAKGKKAKADKKAAKPVKAVKKEVKKSKEEEKKELNKLYSRLLVDHRKTDVVKSTVAELLKRLGSDNYCVTSNKRQVSRILQACLKYGDAAARSLIFQNTKKDFSLLNLNAHSARFLIKLYNYCNLGVKEFLKAEFFCDKGAPLLFSRYGSDVMDAIYQKLKNKEQLMVLRLYALSNHFLLEKDCMTKLAAIGSVNQLAELIGKSKSRKSCLEKLKAAVLKMVDKAQLVASLSHDIIYLYWKLTDDKAELIDHLHQVFGQLLSTRNGNTVMCDLFGYADKKMRKSMLKGLRTDFPDAVYNQINVSFLIKAIHCTDDTKLSIDCLLRPIQDDMGKVVTHKYGHLFIKSILDPSKDLESATSLKDPAVRQEELQKFLLPVLVEFFKSAQHREMIENKFASQILLALLKASKDATILHSVMDVIRDDVTEEMELMKNLDTLRFIQTLVKKPGPLLEELRPYSILWPIVKPSVHRILPGKCVFLLVDILEAAIKNEDEELISDFKETVTPERLQEACKSLKKKHEKHIGLDILIKLLNR